MRIIRRIIERFDAYVAGEVIERKPPTALTGISPVKMADTYRQLLEQASLRREAIEAEIRRLHAALGDTETVIASLSASLDVLNHFGLEAEELTLDKPADGGANIVMRHENISTSPLYVAKDEPIEPVDAIAAHAEAVERVRERAANEIGGDERY